MNTFRNLMRVLRDKSGAISVSIPELIVTIVVRIVVVGGLVTGIGVMLMMAGSNSASTKASVSLQASSVRFAAEVKSSDFVRGSGTDVVALMKTSGNNTLITTDDTCVISTWRTIANGSGSDLVVDKTTVPGACALSTAVPASSSVHRVSILDNVSENNFSYQNVAGRAITFDTVGNAVLAAAAQPAKVTDEDWADVRPQRVELNVRALARNLTTFAKKANLVGYVDLMNFTAAKDGVKYVPPTLQTAPVAVGAVTVTRSPTVGDIYSGTHEGVHVSFFGGECQDTPSMITVTWTPSSPANQVPVSSTFTKNVDGSSPTTADLPNVRNGADGAVSVAVKCSISAAPVTTTSQYGQSVPTTTLAVNHGATPEQHNLSWTAVSSLPTTFGVTWTADPGKTVGSGDLGFTTDLSKTASFPAGTTYGFATNYAVTPAVNGVNGDVRTGGIVDLWPIAPKAANIAYRPTGSAGRITDGAISWTYPAACPTGTDLYSREHQDLKYDSVTGAAIWGDTTIGSFSKNKTGVVWNPSDAREGHPYGEGITTKCVSPITGSQSATNEAQSPTFYTSMNSPVAPVWDGYNFRDGVRGSLTGFGTCWGLAPNRCIRTYPDHRDGSQGGQWYNSYVNDFSTVCPAGSSIGASHIRYQNLSHPGGTSDRSFGWVTGWQIADSDGSVTYRVDEIYYSCNTLWITSPVSAAGNYIDYTLVKIW